MNACFTTEQLPNDFDFHSLDNPVSTVPVSTAHMSAPAADFSSHINVPVNWITEIVEDKLNVFVWGEVTYEDIFHQPHITEFCYFPSGANLMPMGQVLIESDQCDHYNCADQNCPEKWGDNSKIDCRTIPTKQNTGLSTAE